MPLLQKIQPRKKAVYYRGMVACVKCAAPIYLSKLNALPDEFSLRCARCGNRGFYFKRDVVIEELPERRRKPRRER
jgi:hypothetical protein